MIPDQPKVTEVLVWVCTSCGRVFEKRPSKGRGGQDAKTRHKVYPSTSPTEPGRSFKLGSWYWCGPIEVWMATPRGIT